ncbi:hypothetical protein H2248_004940 [Termitomyces sp. 'cryptogamus']|nr:hypothetical protein H2248_004940 [Termitomyces sp. 'cryptogamus']
MHIDFLLFDCRLRTMTCFTSMTFQPHAKRTFSQDSDFPHTFSWSSSSEAMTGCLSYSQSLSTDIIRFDNLEIVAPITSPIVTALDPTTLEAEFDHSCLEGLDEQLLNSPIDAYAAICLAEAVNESEGSSHGLFLSGSPVKEGSDEPCGSLFDESDPDGDECRTLNGHGLSLPIETYNLAVIPHVSYPPPNCTQSHFTPLEPSEKFILEPRITHFDPADSIGLFPMPQRKVKVTGVAALRAYLPLRRKESSNI